jgi:exonuclease SbcC
MTSSDAVRAIIGKHFEHVTDLGNGILRAERRHGDKPFAVAFVDLSDTIVERSSNLKTFQEKLLGESFFATDNDLRWNSYLFLLAGPNSKENKGFNAAKASIEADRHFARKFVVDPEGLAARLGESISEGAGGLSASSDAGAVWTERLRAASLGILLDQRPRTVVLELISSGEVFKAEVGATNAAIVRKKDSLATGLLRKLVVDRFRRINSGTRYEFGDVNLIFGPNGSGKTSLLEAIEVLYCGRARRDPDAAIGEIRGEFEVDGGGKSIVDATDTVATLKARNTAWYGRTEAQASAISQGFTRFNFLDTDAAFRLSSESNNERIKEDLSSLIVGPETSKLWNYLSKLNDEIANARKRISDRLPDVQKNVDLLTVEVRRLRDLPSEASSLTKAFRESVVELRPTWSCGEAGAELSASERVPIEEISKSLALIVDSISEPRLTKSGIEQGAQSLREVVDRARRIQEDFDEAVKQSSALGLQAKSLQEELAQLEMWERVLLAGIPALEKGIRDTDRTIATLRTLLTGQLDAVEYELVDEHRQLPIRDASRVIQAAQQLSIDRERRLSSAVAESSRRGQALSVVAKDLHDVALAFIERSGQSTECPVCKTPHVSNELFSKISTLVARAQPIATDSLRTSLQLARDDVSRFALQLKVLEALERFRIACDGSGDAKVAEMRAGVQRASNELAEAIALAHSLRSQLDRQDFGDLRTETLMSMAESAGSVLPSGTDPFDSVKIRSAIEEIKSRLDAGARMEREWRERLSKQVQFANELANRELSVPASNLTPAHVLASVERSLSKAEDAIEQLRTIASKILLPDEVELDKVLATLQVSLVTFDKAFHAQLAEGQVAGGLKDKTNELQIATALLATQLSTRGNLDRAGDVLGSLVNEFSLDKVTGEAFNSIKSRVSSIFAQIHSPSEYEVGSFDDGNLIVRREDKSHHDVNQISTGQRAGLALSIFLALNASAKTAPPIVLIDDPVAHIDDLNALSFLDYLRDVAIRNHRQIFFATADVRLAALFSRKFEFLGERRFKRLELRSSGR